jgi:Glutathione S-transferase, N-terminal domain
MAPSLTLYTDKTPNGYKASVTLEELGLEYETMHIKISTGEQKKPEFLEVKSISGMHRCKHLELVWCWHAQQPYACLPIAAC